MVSPKPLSRSERRKARTMAAILDAAERHFLERGYEDARVDEIAEAADVAVGSIYNHFGSKEGLYAALAERALELHALYMSEGVDPDRPPLERLLDVAGRLARFGREHPGYLRILALPPHGLGESGEDLAARVRAHLADQERRTAALIEAAIREGDVRPLGARHAAEFVWSAWLGMLTLGRAAERTAPGADDAALRRVVEAGLRIVVGGLASDRARESDQLVRTILETTPAARGRAGDRGLALRREPVARELLTSFPGLGLWTVTVEAAPARSSARLRRRLAQAGERLGAAEATGLRGESTPWAYRVFLRRLGADPDAPRGAVEEVALQRPSAAPEPGGLPDDALLVATLETGVPVLAFDADRLDGALALRLAGEGERLGETGRELAAGEAVIADLVRPVAVLFGDMAPGAAVGPQTRRLALAAIQVKGVPDVSVQEALWTAVEILRG
jgi:AcrR family transcriptional regulator/DNA/RNA-binding domain of Phe-tRNA-synthetase-like protein